MTIQETKRSPLASALSKCARRVGQGGLKKATLVLLCAAMAAPLTAQTYRKGNVLVVSNDRGGLIRTRAEHIRALRKSGRRVEIRGRICYSTCTMYLGLPSTCVDPNTSFGFHGPSYYGARLSAKDFEYWSKLIASHYPEPLKSWYLREGRNRIIRHYKIKGRELIQMGIAEC